MSKLLFNFHDVILFFIMLQCVLLGMVFFFNRQAFELRLLLILGFFVSCFAVPLDILISFGEGFRGWVIDHQPNWFYVFDFGYWLQGPFLLWYVRSIIYKNFSLDWSDLVYVAPYILFVAHQLFSYHSLSSELKSIILARYDLGNEPFSVFIITFAREMIRVFFGCMCVIELRRYKTLMSNKFTSSEGVDVEWLKVFVTGFLCFWLWGWFVSALVLVGAKLNISLYVSILGLSSNYALSLFLSAMIVYLMMRSSVFVQIEKMESVQKPAQKVSINPEYVGRLETLMSSDKPFLDHSLTLDTLAAKLSVSPRTLSKVINGHYGCNFFEFINKYRIEEAKKLLVSESYRNSTVLDIMLEVGFNSKATFNNFFKKNEGMTPREYKKNNIKEVVV